MILWLQKFGNYTSNGNFFLFILGLTLDEKSELESLRNEIKKYRDLESTKIKEEETHSQKSYESVI